jgi:hypothetical protein
MVSVVIPGYENCTRTLPSFLYICTLSWELEHEVSPTTMIIDILCSDKVVYFPLKDKQETRALFKNEIHSHLGIWFTH